MDKPSNRPRKLPKQDRSTDLVSAIFEASVRIFNSAKASQFSTRAVAELAGISVGSLYQYFPNKEALIGALIEREARLHVVRLEERYGDVKDKSFEVVVAALTNEIISVTEKDKTFLRKILPNTFYVDRLGSVIEARNLAVQFIATVLAEKGNLSEVASLKKAYTIVAALAGIIETLIFRTDEPVTVSELEQEAVKMILGLCR